MTSEEYIIKLLQTIESLNSTMMAMREEIAFLREKLAKMDAALEGKELEQERQWALIDAKDEDNKRLGKQIADLPPHLQACSKTRATSCQRATATSSALRQITNQLGELIIMLKPQVLHLRN